MSEVSVLQVIEEIKTQAGEQLGERLRKGAGLFQAGAVCYLGENEWLVDSSQPGERYRVTFGLAWHCTCPDYKHRAPETEFLGGVQQTCKHIIACVLSWLIDSPEAAQRPHPAAYVTIPAWLVDPDFGKIPTAPTAEYQRILAQETERLAAHQDSADMGHQVRDAAPPAWFGQNDNIEDYLG